METGIRLFSDEQIAKLYLTARVEKILALALGSEGHEALAALDQAKRLIKQHDLIVKVEIKIQ